MQRQIILITFLLLFVSFVQSTEMILQLDPNETVESFELKYSKLIQKQPSKNPFKYIELGQNLKICLGDFNSNVIQSAYFDKSIKRISQDRTIQISEIQEFAPKHLVRLSQINRIRHRQLMQYNYEGNTDSSLSMYPHEKKSSINVYVLDTGIKLNHPEFNGRVRRGYDYLNDFKNDNLKSTNSNGGDLNGHGTAVAGVVGSEVFGVCKNCNIVDYRCFNENGISRLRIVLESLYYLVKNEPVGVILLPLITERNEIFNAFLNEVVDLGFGVVTSAGNFNLNACGYSPGSLKNVLTIGSIDSINDDLTFFSNWGECVDVFADGFNVLTLSSNSDLVVAIKSGTSMSAGVGAGLMANLMNLNFTASESLSKIRNGLSIVGKIPEYNFVDKFGTPNKILNNNNGKLSEIV